jgi:ABC-2 type transport system permease protein
VLLPPGLRTDLEIARRGYLRYAAYPAATAAGAFTNIIFGLMRGSVLLALFAERQRIGAYDAAATITYVWLTQGLLNVVAMWGWQELAIRVRTGDIATDLIRPIHPIRAGLATDYGRAVYQLIFRGVPPVVVGAVAFHAVLPTDPAVWLAFAASLTLAIAVSYGFRLLYNLLAFWTTDTRGTMILALVVMSVFSGFTIPIQFFPPWLAAVANATPFPAMVQTPIDILIGVIAGPSVLVALSGQLAWAVAMLGASYWLFALGTRRLVVQGG